jgi:hypothetical protein
MRHLLLGRCPCRYASLALVVPFLLMAGCAPALKQSPVSEYVAGIKDAIDSAQPQRIPTLVVTWGAAEVELGQCKRIAGQTVVYLNVGKITDSVGTVEEARALIAEVLLHELAHARLTCSDADHAHLPLPAPRAVPDTPSVLKRYAWDEFAVGERVAN